MKKLLLLFLLPLFSYGQEILLDHSYTDPEGFVVGQTINVKFNMIFNVDASPTYTYVDYEFNNKLLQLTGATFYSADQTWYYEYTGYKFIGTDGVEVSHLTSQRNTGIGYDSSQNDWSIVRFSLQDVETIPQETPMVEFTFTIKDKANTGYADYSNITNLNWVEFRDNRTNTNYDVHSMTQRISLNEVTGGDAGVVTINLNTPSQDPTHFTYTVKHTGTQAIVTSGHFDQNYQANISELENDQMYHIHIDIDDQLAAEWLDQVVTVSDAFINFQQAISTTQAPDGSGAYYDYSLQYLLGEVDNSGNVTSDDSYIMLNHIMGNNTSEWFTSLTNGGYLYSGRKENYGVSTNEYYFGMNPYITPTDSEKVFTFNAGLVGDVDFSHSTIPTAQTQARNSMAKTSARAEEYNLDISTQLVNGKVVMETILNKEELAGIQFIIQYDDDILSFDSIEFDTGSEITNFATPKDNKIYFGSIDTTGQQSVKIGTPYKLIFTPNQTITNTSGLIYFNVADAIKQDGTKVILKVQ